MQEGQLLMTQADRDRLVTLRKAKKRLITQRQAAEELKLSVRQVKRLVYALKKRGDKAVIQGLRGKPSNQRIGKSVEEEAMQILSADLYNGFGPTLASEYLADKHDIEVSKETLRQWMIRAKLWRAKGQKVKAVHLWRPRRSRIGELVQWDTSEHDWLEGRREAVPDRHDRRCDEPAVRAVRAARFERREHEAAVALRGEVRAPAGVLYGQGQYLPNGGKAQAGRAGSRQRPCGDAAYADRTRAAGTGNRVDTGAQSAGERASGEEFRNGAGSTGEGNAGGGSEEPRTRQPIP